VKNTTGRRWNVVVKAFTWVLLISFVLTSVGVALLSIHR
jgi:hypothetical protein